MIKTKETSRKSTNSRNNIKTDKEQEQSNQDEDQ